MKKQELRAAIEKDWTEWQALVTRVGEQRMTEQGVGGGEWSLKDIIAHVTFYENEMVGMLRARELAGSDLWELPLEQRNRALFERQRDRPLAGVLAESAQVHAQLMSLLNEVTDMDLADATHFKAMPGEWTPWEVIASNTFEHYRDHTVVVGAWLDGMNRQDAKDAKV